MEMGYHAQWQAEIAALQQIVSGFGLTEECKWGKPCYTLDGRNVVIIQGFKGYCALNFFKGAALKDPKKLLVQLGQVQAARVMKFTSTKDIQAKAATIKAYLREAIAAEKAGVARDQHRRYLCGRRRPVSLGQANGLGDRRRSHVDHLRPPASAQPRNLRPSPSAGRALRHGDNH